MWWPGEYIKQPFGEGSKTYSELEIMHMIYDLEEISHYSELFDQFSILSGQPNQGFVVNGQVINAIVPSGWRGELFYQAGDYFTYCISTKQPRVFGQLLYKPDTCQIKFKMRAAALFNKLPGFFRMSGYVPLSIGVPSLIMTPNQMLHIIQRTSDTFPELS